MPSRTATNTNAASGEIWPEGIGRLAVRVLWPDAPGLPSEDPNGRAVVLLASYGDIDVLLTADAESDVLRRLPLGPVEILKVSHHGSEDPGLPALLERLRPRIAIISAGRGNDYGHPRPETLAALAAVPGLAVYRTDLDGTVVVESDGRTLAVRSDRRSGRRRRRPIRGPPSSTVAPCRPSSSPSTS